MKLVGFLLLLGFALTYWQWLAMFCVVVVAVRLLLQRWRIHQTLKEISKAEVAGLAARADQEHQWFMAGDPRGTHGRYTPEPI